MINKRILDLAVESNLVPSLYFLEWDTSSEIQFRIVTQVMKVKKKHTFLDIGCGGLRLGHLLIPILNDNKYFGIDTFLPYLNFGKKLLKKDKIFKKHKLYHSEKLDFDYFKIKFDFAFAHSVLGHLSKDQVIKLFNNLKKNMKKNGYFYATINFGWWSQQNIGFLYEGITPMNHPVYKDINVYKKISKELNLTFEEVDFKHPSQKLVRFKF